MRKISLDFERDFCLEPILPDHLLVPLGAVFQVALLGFVIHPDNAEALGIAVGPFEVVEQGPDEISGQGDAGLDGAVGRSKVGPQIVDAMLVGDAAFFIGRGGVAGAVLGDVELGRLVVEVDASQYAGQAVGVIFPAHLGPMLRSLRLLEEGLGIVVRGVGAVDAAGVIVQADKIGGC